MDILLVGILKSLLLPPACLMILVIIGVHLLLRKRKGGIEILLATLLAWYLLSIPFMANQLIKSVETYPPLQSRQIAMFKPQAIVVLGGGVRQYAPEFGPAPTVNFKTLERLRYAAKLANLTHLPILVTGGKVFEYDDIAEAEAMTQSLAEDFGIPARWKENLSRNTAENARFSFALLQKAQITRILLVTHALHMPRAAKEFSASGFEILPASTGYLSDYSPKELLHFFPSANALMQSNSAIHEHLGNLWMQLKSNFT